MALKGKKKASSRGSAGRRAPAGAPRHVATGPRDTPWYQTTRGRIIGGVIALALVGVLAVLALNARSNSAERTAAAEALDRYAGQVRALLQRVTPPAGEMAALPSEPSAKTLEAIEDGAPQWKKSLQEAGVQAGAMTPPEEVTEAHGLFIESMLLYGSTATTYELALDAGGEAQAGILAAAAEERGHAESVWAAGIGILDGELADLGADPSGLRLPSSPGAAAPQPEGGTGGDATGGAGGGGKDGGAGGAKDSGAGGGKGDPGGTKGDGGGDGGGGKNG